METVPEAPSRVGGSLNEEMAGVTAREVAPPRCARCDNPGHTASDCPVLRQPRGEHPDAQLGDNVPHMHQLPWEELSAAPPGGAKVLRVEGHLFALGWADGEDNNCLIDTLRQQLEVQAVLSEVRHKLVAAFPRGPQQVQAWSFLELQHHREEVVRHLGRDPESFRVVCVDLQYPGNGDVVGQGAQTLYIARGGANHFVPLRRHLA